MFVLCLSKLNVMVVKLYFTLSLLRTHVSLTLYLYMGDLCFRIDHHVCIHIVYNEDYAFLSKGR